MGVRRLVPSILAAVLFTGCGTLEDADAEAQGKKTADGEAAEGAEDEVELEDEGLDDAAFIEEQEEGDEDVTDIIGDVDDEEET